MAEFTGPSVAVVISSWVTGHLTLVSLKTHPRFTFCADTGGRTLLAVLLTSPANVGIIIEVEAVGTGGDARVGALVEVGTSPARGTLVAATPNTGLTQGGALLAALPIVTEKTTGALRHAHPGVVLELEEVMEAVDAVMGSGTLAAILIAFRVTGTVVLLCELLIGGQLDKARLLYVQGRVWVDRGAIQHQRPLLQFARYFLAAKLRRRVVDL